MPALYPPPPHRPFDRRPSFTGARHEQHRAARRLGAGWYPSQVANALDCDPVTIHLLLREAEFSELLRAYRTLRQLAPEQRLTRLGLSFVIGGAIGNLIDRVIFGYVLDFFDFYRGGWHFWAFNVADAAINIGVALMILDMLGVGRLYRVSRTL